MAADAQGANTNYVDRMRTKLWPYVQRYWFDALIVAAAIGGALEIVLNQSAPDAPTLPLGVSVPLEIALTLLLLARRRFPFGAPAGMFVAAAALSFWDARLLTYSLGGFLGALAAGFLLGLLEEHRQALIGLAITLAAIFIILWNDPSRGAGDVIFTPLLFSIVWLFAFGLSRKLEQARPDQEREREALLVVEQAGREALAEMRRLVGVLRRPEEAPALAPQPSLKHIERLVEQARESGLAVDVRIEGEA